MESPLISVIVPVFNAETTLRKCIRSILDQEYPNLEIILVDDGSQDQSGYVCEELCNQNDNIICIHSPNKGVSHARNLGLQKYKGLFCTFVDADDEIGKDFIRIMLDTAVHFQAPLVTCSFLTDEQVEAGTQMEGMREARVYPIEAYDLLADYTHSTVWGALYAREAISGIWFDESLQMGEDTLFFMQVIFRSKIIAHISAPLYTYHQNESSLTRCRYSNRNRSDILAWMKICKMSEKESDKMQKMCRMRLAGCCKRNLRMIIRDGYTQKDEKSEILRILRKECRNIVHSPISYIRKAEYMMIMYMPHLYSCLYRCYLKRQ